MDPTASARAALTNWTGLAPAKSGESMGRVREDSTADLEVGVEVGEADGGGVLQRAVRLAPALQRRACPRCRPSPRTPCGLMPFPDSPYGLARDRCVKFWARLAVHGTANLPPGPNK